MASRFLHLRRLLPSTNRSTLIGRRASVSVSVSPLPRRPVSALYHTCGTVSFGAGKSFPYIYKALAYDDKHWIISMRPPSNWSRNQIIDFYLKTLAKVVGSLEEARMKMYTVSTEDVFNFRAYLSEEQAGKLYEMEGVKYVIPDVFVDDQLYEPDPVLDFLQQPQRKPSSPHILDHIKINSHPDDFTKPINESEIVKLREKATAMLKECGLDDGAIQYLLNTGKDAPAKKLGDCTAQPI